MNSFLKNEANPILVKQLIPVLKGEALDIGLGSGANSLFLKEMGYSVMAMDIDPDAVKKGVDNGIDVLKLSMVDFKWKRKYDCILMLYVLQYVNIAEGIEVLESALKNLSQNGFLYLAIFNNSPNSVGYLDVENLYRNMDEVFLWRREMWHMFDKSHGMPHQHCCEFFIFRKL